MVESGMSKTKLYILGLWLATASMLISTVVKHHHHMGRVCMVEELCEQDGQVNDEHTEHHDQESEGDRENCSVRQMHHFVTNAREVKGLKQLLSDGSHDLSAPCCFAFCLVSYSFAPCFSLVTARWQHTACPLSCDGLAEGLSRRGPPNFFAIRKCIFATRI